MALTRDEFFWTSFAEHSERAVKAAALLTELIRDPTQVEAKRQAIGELERQADQITHDVMSALHQTWITPLDREEIHGLIKTLDDVVDAIDGVAERFSVYGVSKSRDEALALAAHIETACAAMRDSVRLLSNTKNGAAALQSMAKIGKEEHGADKILSNALRRLFAEEKDAIEIIKWRDLYERLERVTDRTLDVANIIEAVVLEHA